MHLGGLWWISTSEGVCHSVSTYLVIKMILLVNSCRVKSSGCVQLLRDKEAIAYKTVRRILYRKER